MTNPLPLDIAQFKLADREIPIESFIVSGMRGNQLNALGQPLIHWRAHGVYRGVTLGYAGLYRHSTCFDTEMEDDGTGRVNVQLKTYTYASSRNAAKSIEIPLAKANITSDTLREIIIKEKLNYYRYNGNGSGCQTWTLRFAQVLEDRGILRPGSVAHIRNSIHQLALTNQYWIADEAGAEFYQ